MILILIGVMLFALPAQAEARNIRRNLLPSLTEFIAQVRNGEPETLRGAYIPNLLAMTIVPQPRGADDYISPMSSVLTQFGMAAKAGSVGLLAHNYLAGRHFSEIELGDPVILVYGGARAEFFTVTEILRYQTLPDGSYVDTATQARYRMGEVFQRAYAGEYHLTLQTCIAKGGDLNWGRLFIIAKPIEGVAPPPPPPTLQARHIARRAFLKISPPMLNSY